MPGGSEDTVCLPAATPPPRVKLAISSTCRDDQRPACFERNLVARDHNLVGALKEDAVLEVHSWGKGV